MTRRMALILCGAGPAGFAEHFIKQAHERGWSVRVLLTPSARSFVDETALEAQTGEPVRHSHRAPGAPRSAPVDLFVVAPASANTINKLALGIADTYALDVLAEAVGCQQPVIILPFVNTSLADRAPFQRSVASLREEGVHMLFGPELFEPHPPRTGTELFDSYPWHLALDQADKLIPKA